MVSDFVEIISNPCGLKKGDLSHMLKILFLSVCYTIAFYSSTILTNHYSPLFMMGLRGLVSGILLLAIRYSYEKKIRINLIKYKHQYLYAIIFGFIAPFALNATILNRLPVIDTTILYTAEPIITYLFAAYFFREHLNKKQILYLLLGTAFAFTAVIIEAEIERVSLISWQEPLILFIAMIMAIGWLVVERLTRLKEPEDAIVGIGLITTGIVASVMSLHLEDVKFTTDMMPVLLFLLMIFFGDLIVTRMRAKLSKQYSATLLSLICIFVPFITALHEQIFSRQQYSYKFFLIIIPSMLCFMAFYYEERKAQIKKLL